MSIKIKQRKNCGPNFVSKIKQLTNELYRECADQAREEIDKSGFDVFEVNGKANDIKFVEYINKVKVRSHELYQKKILELTDQELQDILFVHEKGKFMRADYTIEGIVSELARRSLFNDSSADK